MSAASAPPWGARKALRQDDSAGEASRERNENSQNIRSPEGEPRPVRGRFSLLLPRI